MAGADLPDGVLRIRGRVSAANPSAWGRRETYASSQKPDSAVPPPALDT